MYAAHQLSDRFDQQEQYDCCCDRSDGNGAEELGQWIGLEQSGQPAGNYAAHRNRQEPDPHHQTDYALRCELCHETESYRTQTQFAKFKDKVNANQLERAHTRTRHGLGDRSCGHKQQKRQSGKE